MLTIHHIRNATMLIEAEDIGILVDPLLAPKGTMPSYTEKRFNPQRNPTVDLPKSTSRLLKKVTHCLITHLHSDHLDETGIAFLTKRNIPVICSLNDCTILENKGLQIVKTIDYWKKSSISGITIEGIPALHGYGEVAKLMGNVMGYFIEITNQKSIYLSSDTIYTADVKRVLTQYKPDIAVVACGSAQLDEHEPILMTLQDILSFIKDAPNQVIANHLEAVNHCPTSRKQLNEELLKYNLSDKVWIPEDGGSKTF